MALGKEVKGVKFIKVSASDLNNKYIGGGEKRLKLIFEIAEAMAPSILFIDEIDGIMRPKTDNNAGMASVLLICPSIGLSFCLSVFLFVLLDNVPDRLFHLSCCCVFQPD